MSMVRNIGTLTAVLLGLTGCQSDCNTREYDPRTGKFGAGMAGLMSGCYEKRVTDQQTRLDETKARQERLARHVEKLKAKRARREARLFQIREDVNQFQSKVDNLRNKVNNLTAKSAADRDKIKSLKEQIAALIYKIDNWDQIQKQSKNRLATLEVEKERLSTELDQLLQIYLALSQ